MSGEPWNREPYSICRAPSLENLRDFKISLPILTSLTGSSDREILIVSPIPSKSNVPNPIEDFTGSSEDLIFGPNPMNSSGQLTLIFELLEDQETYFEIFNPLGQLIYSKSILLNAGFYGPNYTQLVLDLSEIDLSSGIYSLSTNINNSKTVKQLWYLNSIKNPYEINRVS